MQVRKTKQKGWPKPPLNLPYSSVYTACTFSAWNPFGPFTTSNCTAWPSWRLRNPPDWMAEKCTKTSSPF
jgi:hypothetical protein